MPAPLDVDHEAVKTLAIAVGVREAARQMEIPEATVQAWSAREGWFMDVRTVKPPTMRPVTIATKPGRAMANSLESAKTKTRLNLSRFCVNASQVASKSRSPLADATNVKAVASVMQTLWPEQQQPGVQLNIWGGGFSQDQG